MAAGLVLAGIMFGVYLFVFVAPGIGTFGYDAYAYWSVSMPEPYLAPVGALGSYNYSPAFAQVADWFSSIDWWVFLYLWTCLLVGSVIWIAGSPIWVAVAFAIPLVSVELYHGNIHILLAVAIVLGFRHPWTWSFVLLTKPSAGVGLLWFVVARRMAQAGDRAGHDGRHRCGLLHPRTTGLVRLVRAASGQRGLHAADATNLPIPLWIRLPMAAVVVVWGARTDRRWTVVLASMMALPVLWPGSGAMLIGLLPDLRRRYGDRPLTRSSSATA